MSQDSIVTTQDVLRAITQIKRRGLNAAIRELEATEPDLTEHLLEETSAIHQRLYRAHLDRTHHLQLTRRIQRLCVALVVCTQMGYRRLQSLDTNDGFDERSEDMP